MKGLTHNVPEHAKVLSSLGAAAAGFLESRFSVLVWNMYKARLSGWATDFSRLARGTDLVLLQEVFLRPAMVRALLQVPGLRWDMAVGFTRRLHEINVGVMTGCRAEPLELFYLRSPSTEPLVRLPKMVIGGRYLLAGGEHQLLVLNVHAINFVRINKFKHQMLQIEEEVGRHAGPVLLAGDFNTWIASRTSFLNDMTAGLQMELVSFSPDRRTRWLGQVVDHVFVRGLNIAAASCVYEVNSSDHRPILIEMEVREARSQESEAGRQKRAARGQEQ